MRKARRKRWRKICWGTRVLPLGNISGMSAFIVGGSAFNITLGATNTPAF